MDLECEKVTSTSVPIIKYMEENLFKNFSPWSIWDRKFFKRQNDRADLDVQNSIKIYLGWYGHEVTFTSVHIVKCMGLFLSLNDQTEFELLYGILIWLFFLIFQQLL